MLKLDIRGLVDAVSAQAGRDRRENRVCGTAYLISHVVLPYIGGKKVRLDGLDFDAFDEDDLGVLLRNCEDQSAGFLPALSLFSDVLSAPPATLPVMRYV